MSRSKKLYILLGLLLAACAGTFAVTRMEERRERIKSSGEIILELPGDSVQSLSWEYGETALAFHKEETWLYDADEAFPVSEERIHSLLEQFEAFGASFVIEAVEDYGQYGLDDPVCTIRLATEEQSYEIKLGDYSKMDSQRYVSIGDGNVYLAQNDPLDQFDAQLRDMIDNDETPAFDGVTEVRFAGGENYTLFYAEDSADTYCADDVYFARRDGKNLPLDTSKVDSYLRTVSSLSPTDYASYNVTEEELRSYGLDAPDLTVTVEYTSTDEDGGEERESFVLHISRDPEERKSAEEAAANDDEAADEAVTAYARIGGSRIVYNLSSGSYQALMAASYDDLRHEEVFWADFADVRQIDILLEGVSYTIASEENDDGRAYFYQDGEVEIGRFQDALEALRADRFTGEEPTQREEIGLTVYLAGEDYPQISIKLYRYDGTYCLAEVDGEPVSLVERAAAVDLVEAVHAIVLQ